MKCGDLVSGLRPEDPKLYTVMCRRLRGLRMVNHRINIHH